MTVETLPHGEKKSYIRAGEEARQTQDKIVWLGSCGHSLGAFSHGLNIGDGGGISDDASLGLGEDQASQGTSNYLLMLFLLTLLNTESDLQRRRICRTAWRWGTRMTLNFPRHLSVDCLQWLQRFALLLSLLPQRKI
jgi:hypothetical protein